MRITPKTFPSIQLPAAIIFPSVAGVRAGGIASATTEFKIKVID
jgi:hypothetical protein